MNGADSLRGLWDAVDRSHAILLYQLDGTILEANQIVCAWLDHPAETLIGSHVDRLRANDPAHPPWPTLADGTVHDLPREQRITRSGATIWLHSRYSPVFDTDGTLSHILQIATDVTLTARREAETFASLTAIQASNAVITFDANGLILHANDAYLTAMSFQLDEIVGRHHRIFVEPSFAHSAEYALFWRELGQGKSQAGQYRRFTRDRSEVWLQAIYNPVFDADGKLCKVIKLATTVTEEKLRQAEHQGQIAAIHNALCVISFDVQGNIRDANDNFLDSMGYRLAEVRGRHHSMFVDPAYADSDEYRTFWTNLAAGHHQAGEFKRFGKHGDEVWVQATYNPVLDLNGHPFRVVKYATVVTDQKLRQADLQGQIAAIDKSQGLISFDLQGIILDVNENFCAAVGYAAHELIGQPHRLLVDPEIAGSPEYQIFWETLRAGNFVSGLYRRIGKGGRPVWIQASYNPILDLNGNPSRIIKFATDVTSNVDMAAAFEDAKRQSQHDPGTALPNRVRLLAFINSILDQPGRRLSILYLDLDRFKPINDTFGHQAGDHVLSQVADRMRRALHADQIAARIGGDEFVIAVPDQREAEVEILCTTLIASISEPIAYLGHELQVGISIGVATTADAATADDLLRCADVAMYRSKQNDRGTVSFYAGTQTQRLGASSTFVKPEPSRPSFVRRVTRKTPQPVL